MNNKIYTSAVRVLFASLLAAQSALAIKIVVPDQYKDQVEEMKKAERQLRERELQGGDAPSDAKGMSIATSEAPEEAPKVAADEFLVQSVVEASATASEYEGTLAADQGLVSGQIVDKESGEPLSGVAILVEGEDIATVTAEDGRYSLGPVAAGQYTLSLIKGGYIEANVTDFTITGGEVSVFPFALPPRPAEMSDDVYELQDFTVTAEEANNLMMKLELKFDSSRALDVFSSEDFSKFAASDVASAVTRISGVSVNDGKFPSVRGLNDRYTVTTMNGMPVPSPDPFRKSPQFDIFPSSLLESIIVSKTASADLSGESTAANFNLITKQLPEEFFLKGSIGTGFHSGSIKDFRTFDRPDSYLLTDAAGGLKQAPFDEPLGSSDPNFQGSEQLGSKERDAQPNVSFSLSTGNTFEFANGGKLGLVFAGYHKRETSAILDAQNVQGYNFNGADRFVPVTITLPPFLGGGTVDTFENRSIPFGDETTYDHEEYEESVKLGALVGASYELNEDHRFFGNFFLSRTADTVVSRNFNGSNPDEQISEESDLFLLREQLYYVERSLALGQIGGEHKLPTIDLEPEMTWGLQRARTSQDEPDFRDTFVVHRYSDYPDGDIPESVSRDNPAYNVNSGDNLSLSSNSWRYVQEDEDTGRLDFALNPMDTVRVAFGGMARRAERTSEIQTFLEGRGDADPTGTTEAGTGITNANLRNGSRSIRGTSAAIRDIDALYLSTDLEPAEWIKLNFGYRFEDSILSVDSRTILDSSNSLANVFRQYDAARAEIASNPSADSSFYVRAAEADVLNVEDGQRFILGDSIARDLEDRVYLPSANLTLTPTKGMQLKLGYYETLNRPSFREITPDIFVDVGTGDQLGGNPFLQSSTADNYDFRVELYPEQFEFSLPFGEALFHADDMIGVSLFRKEIENPIEFLRPTDRNLDEIPFNNPEGAVAEGIEFEFSKNLGFVPIPYAEFFTFGGNMSFTSAMVGVSDAEKALLGLNVNTDEAQLDDERQLAEQPDRILNFNLTYEHPDYGTRVTLAYNKKSEILEAIGSEQDYDAFRGPTERLDLIVSHAFENGLTLNFSIKNLLDEGYETYFRNRAPDYSSGNISNMENPDEFGQDQPRKSVDTVGRSFSFSVAYDF
ncbi:TonB-dependent receptor [Coraliomargarita algicola]|uniref:TonB-dependent receptor n=1 Tax=Coraliomargarita algicola TaxID=3092156 RepID=A0ABZ0RFB1_9BACT|nr:TonB-dependent receptor [Coraliomargarita sp. J2-16]WPJ94188.1 TonB-dependent receptor [Coraliomargarita sp. J2-16]